MTLKKQWAVEKAQKKIKNRATTFFKKKTLKNTPPLFSAVGLVVKTFPQRKTVIPDSV